jgi:hypothetical protein
MAMYLNLLSILFAAEIWLEEFLISEISPLISVALAGALLALHYYLVFAGRLKRIGEGRGRS